MASFLAINWEHAHYSSFSSLMCCFLMVSAIWTVPQNMLKQAFYCLLEKRIFQLKEKHNRELGKIPDEAKLKQMEYVDLNFRKLTKEFEHDLDVANRLYKVAAFFACVAASIFLFIGKTDDINVYNLYLLLPFSITILWMIIFYIRRRWALRRCIHRVKEHGLLEVDVAHK